jgi:hypothetical protein
MGKKNRCSWIGCYSEMEEAEKYCPRHLLILKPKRIKRKEEVPEYERRKGE